MKPTPTAKPSHKKKDAMPSRKKKDAMDELVENLKRANEMPIVSKEPSTKQAPHRHLTQ